MDFALLEKVAFTWIFTYICGKDIIPFFPGIPNPVLVKIQI
jgi:hypothetical protein